MDLDQLKQILSLVQDYGVAELELEHEGLRVRVRRDGAGSGPAAPLLVTHGVLSQQTVVGPAAGGVPGPSSVPSAGPPATDGETDIELAVVKSPIVGTFYRSPEPGAAAFVEVGTTVKKGQVLCIIEAMKLMNEIDSEYDGEVVNVYVKNGQPVQYGERLFAIRTK
jgi:acetyl-CoA carboxylase biotin carboxyl carrier protein